MDVRDLVVSSILTAFIGAFIGAISGIFFTRIWKFYTYTRPVRKILDTMAKDSQQLNLFFEIFPIGGYAEIITQKTHMCVIGIEEITSVATAKCLAHVLTLLGYVRSEKNMNYIDSRKFSESDLDSNIICIGGPNTNEATKKLFGRDIKFPYTFKGEKVKFEIAKADGKSWHSTEKADYGLIIRMRNPFSSKKWVLILAGLGPQGTVGAGYYFSEEIKTIAKDFGKEEQFGIVVEVEKELDYRFGTRIVDYARFRG